jgi:photosystem II stability/assembly factor-like uncharacterized protein
MRLTAYVSTLLLVTALPLTAQDEPFAGFEYRMIGPSRGGRVTAVAGHRAEPGTFYLGATGGGVWKTTDYGHTWRNVSDGFFQTPSIGAIQVASSDPAIVYVGTGSDGIRSNVITGRGVYRSDDGGRTWTFRGLRETGQIGAVLVHPTNPNFVYVAALGHPFGPNPDRGVFRSRDGGQTWRKVLFVTDSTGAIDLEFAPDNPSEIYASLWRGERKPWTIISGAREGGVYKSGDGGDTWRKLAGGLPTGLVGKSDLAVSPADPDRVYVLIEAEPGAGLYRSDDRGASFRLVSPHGPLLDRPFYYTNVDADPQAADVVYVSSTQFWKSTDGGATWSRRSTPHGDNHDMWINPDDPDVFIQSNDGGANVTRDGGATWSTQHNQPTAELYQVDVDDQFPYWVYAGQQDNSTIAVPSLPPYLAPGGTGSYWRSIGGCETGPAVPKPGNHNIVYANCKGRFGRYNKETGQEQQYYVTAADMYGHNPKDLIDRFQRVSPIEISPHDPGVVYHASQYLYRTSDEGVTWERISPDLTAFEADRQVISGQPITRDITGEEFYSTLYAVEESPLESGVIWTGANDGPIHITRDGGRTWTDVTPGDLPPNGRVQTIEPSPHRVGKAYVAVYRYLLDDWQPYIYRTTDFGRTWTRLTTGTNGVPNDYPTRVIREDPGREGLLYAGTEFGMFVSFDDGARWQPFQRNLPVTPITDIEVHRADLVLSTMGRSFWILDNVTPLYEWGPRVAAARAHLFTPRAAYRMRYSSFGRSPADPEYLEPGAIIDYAFARAPAEEVRLDVLDAGGTVIRSFSSRAAGESETAVQGMRAPAHVRAGTPRLPTRAGHNRIVWDLSHPGPWAPGARAGRGGPLVIPGTYTVRLSMGDWSAEHPLVVEMDPRVAADGVTLAALREQLELNLTIRDAVSEARMLLERVATQLNRAAGADRTRIETLHRQLATRDDIRYPERKLVDQLEYLYRMTTDADQKPGRDAHQRYATLRRQLDELQAQFRALVENAG